MQPCHSPCVRACPVEVDDSTFAELIDKKGMKLPAPAMEPERPMGEPEGEPGCLDTPNGVHGDSPAVIKRNPSPLLDVDGKPGSVFNGSCCGYCIRKAGMCMMILSAVGLNLTVITALSESWKPASSTSSSNSNKSFRVPVKFPLESSTSIMKVSSNLTPMNAVPAKASKAGPKAEVRKTSIKNTKAAKVEKAPASSAQLPPQVAFVKQEIKQDKKPAPKAVSVDFAAPPSSDSPIAGFGLGDAPISSRKSSQSAANDDQENGAERHGEFLIKMMAPEDESDEDGNKDDNSKDSDAKASVEDPEVTERQKLQDMLHEAEEDHHNEIHKGSLLKPEITPEPTAHPSMNSHARLQAPEDENEGGVIARWGSVVKTKFGLTEQQGNSPAASHDRSEGTQDKPAQAIPLWEAARLKLPSLKSFR